MPAGIVNEDLVRYKLISTYFPFILSAIYTVPIFYYRKLLREKLRVTHLSALRRFIEDHRVVTVICVSHRQAFWTAVLKRNESLDIAIYGVLTEFGNNLGWKYLFWDQMNGFISPLQASRLGMSIPETLPFKCLALPARSSFYSLPAAEAPERHCLLMGGYFGQGRMMHTLGALSSHFPGVHIHAVCGDNSRLERKIREQFGRAGNITVYGLLDSIEDLLSRCGCVVTKPGMATLLEANASGRKIFLFRGMPVAESNNARHAISHFHAEWFSVSSFSRWLMGCAADHALKSAGLADAVSTGLP